ncbi:MAG: response regulator, partial [Planctomycetota bacterium]
MVAPSRILVVDDEEQIAKLLAGVLRGAGHATDFETDGEAALGRIRRQAYDLLVTDLRMPGVDGLRLIEEAKRADPDVDVVIITAYATPESAVRALREGVVDYVNKPFTVEEIRSAVAKALTAREERLRRKREVRELSALVETTQLDAQLRRADLAVLHDMTRLIAAGQAPLRRCLEMLARHLKADAVALTRDDTVVERTGKAGDAELLALAAVAARTGQP